MRMTAYPYRTFGPGWADPDSGETAPGQEPFLSRFAGGKVRLEVVDELVAAGSQRAFWGQLTTPAQTDAAAASARRVAASPFSPPPAHPSWGDAASGAVLHYAVGLACPRSPSRGAAGGALVRDRAAETGGSSAMSLEIGHTRARQLVL